MQSIRLLQHSHYVRGPASYTFIRSSDTLSKLGSTVSSFQLRTPPYPVMLDHGCLLVSSVGVLPRILQECCAS